MANRNTDRHCVRARELYEGLGRRMRTNPLWPVERVHEYVADTPISRACAKCSLEDETERLGEGWKELGLLNDKGHEWSVMSLAHIVSHRLP